MKHRSCIIWHWRKHCAKWIGIGKIIDSIIPANSGQRHLFCDCINSWWGHLVHLPIWNQIKRVWKKKRNRKNHHGGIKQKKIKNWSRLERNKHEFGHTLHWRAVTAMLIDMKETVSTKHQISIYTSQANCSKTRDVCICFAFVAFVTFVSDRLQMGSVESYMSSVGCLNIFFFFQSTMVGHSV